MEQDKSKIHFGHNKTVQEIETIRDKQSGKDLTPFKYFPANRLSAVKDEHVLREFGKYQVVDHEMNSYHVYQETRSFHQTSGAKLSVGSVQKYSVDTFNRLNSEKVKGFKGFTHVIILHDPTIKEAEKVQKMQEQGNSFGEVAPQSSGTDVNLPPSMTLEEAKAKYKEAKGRLPHHSWTLETILKKLAE